MRRYRSGSRWSFWRWTVVGNYLIRLHLVQTPWFSLMLHWILAPDPVRHLHDHPVSFWSLVVRGGYVERTPAGWRRWRRWSVHRMRTTSRHRIVQVEPRTTTLVLAGPVRQPWGYWVDGVKRPWRDLRGSYVVG